jgi:hypothetical protein
MNMAVFRVVMSCSLTEVYLRSRSTPSSGRQITDGFDDEGGGGENKGWGSGAGGTEGGAAVQ